MNEGMDERECEDGEGVKGTCIKNKMSEILQ